MATLDSCTLLEDEGRGLNQLLRTVVYHLLVTQLNCPLLYSYTSNRASSHILRKHFGWTEPPDERVPERIAFATDGDLAELVGDYSSVHTAAYEALVGMY